MSDPYKPSTVLEPSAPEAVERRRPGRTAYASSTLLPLLREVNELSPDSEESQEKALGPARGIVFGTLISGLFWAFLIWIV